MSYLAGLSAAGQFSSGAIMVFMAIVLYVNSKQALTHWLKREGRDSRNSLGVFVLQAVCATLLTLGVVWHSLTAVLPFLAIPAAYLLFSRMKGEHFILTEVTGFFLLAVAAPLAELAASGHIDLNLYIGVAVFFTAGVFKVRVQLTKSQGYRILMVVYLVFAALVYQLLALPLVALLPLADNLVFTAILYKVKLRTAGRLELAKGVLFVILIAAAYGGH